MLGVYICTTRWKLRSHDLWHVNRKQRDSWGRSIINNWSSVGFILQSVDRWSDRSVTLCVEATSLPVYVFNPSRLLIIDYYHVHEWSGRSSSSPSVASSSCLFFVGFDACFNLFCHFQIKTWNAAGWSGYWLLIDSDVFHLSIRYWLQKRQVLESADNWSINVSAAPWKPSISLRELIYLSGEQNYRSLMTNQSRAAVNNGQLITAE